MNRYKLTTTHEGLREAHVQMEIVKDGGFVSFMDHESTKTAYIGSYEEAIAGLINFFVPRDSILGARDYVNATLLKEFEHRTHATGIRSEIPEYLTKQDDEEQTTIPELPPEAVKSQSKPIAHSSARHALRYVMGFVEGFLLARDKTHHYTVNASIGIVRDYINQQDEKETANSVQPLNKDD